jgi:hypothetical protein
MVLAIDQAFTQIQYIFKVNELMVVVVVAVV